MAEDTVGLVPAAGWGTRLGMGPKAFLNLAGSSLISRVVNMLITCVDRVIVGVPHNYLEHARSELAGLAEVHPGGKSRQATIFSLFEKCTEQIIVIWDISRPFAGRDLVLKVIDGAKKHRAAAAFTPTSVPVAYHRDGFVTASILTSEVLLPQAPQAFHHEIVERACQNAVENGIEDHNTLELVLRLGIKVLVIPGDERNIKMTTPFDWEIANRVIIPSIHNSDELGVEKA